MNVELERTHASILSSAKILQEVINVIALKANIMEQTKMADAAIKMNVPQKRLTTVIIPIKLAQIILVAINVWKNV